MNLLEHVANKIFTENGISMAEGYVVSSPKQVREFDGEIFLKAQVPSGGRGKAGGIQSAGNLPEAREKTGRLLESEIAGFPVNEVFVQSACEILKEYYLSITVDRSEKKPVLLFSAEGGVDVESSEGRGRITRIPIDPLNGFDGVQVKAALAKSIEGDVTPFVDVSEKLHEIFVQNDAVLCEINPLAETPDGLVGLDAKMTLDDNSIFRHKQLSENKMESNLTEIERKARDAGLSYVELDGNIAVIGCGAGLVMASLDSLNECGGRAANFMDVGGGASAETMQKAIKLTLAKPGVKSLFLNMFCGITRGDEVAEAIKEVKVDIPLSVRLVGTREEEGKKILKESGIPVFDSMQQAAKKAVEDAR